eukprot:s3252_g7.t1
MPEEPKSVEAVELLQYRKGQPSFPSTCRFTGIALSYHCNAGLVSADAWDGLGQLLSFRIDCRAGGEHFQNITLYDTTSPFCGRLSYRKYGNTSDIEIPTTPWLPLISDHIVTVQKGDVVDIQCVPLPFELLSNARPGDSSETTKNAKMVFHLLTDGQIKSQQLLPVIQINLRYPAWEFQSCAETLAKAYQWKMVLKKSMNYSHWVLFSSPTLEVPKIVPKVDLCCEQHGEIFKVDKDYLQVRLLEAAGQRLFNRPYEMVKLDPQFYSENTSSLNSYAVEVKLEVNAAALPRGTRSVMVKLGVHLRPKPAPLRVFTLMLPVHTYRGPQDDSKALGSWISWLMLLAILILLVVAVCYVFREAPGPQTNCSPTGTAVEMRGR